MLRFSGLRYFIYSFQEQQFLLNSNRVAVGGKTPQHRPNRQTDRQTDRRRRGKTGAVHLAISQLFMQNT